MQYISRCVWVHVMNKVILMLKVRTVLRKKNRVGGFTPSDVNVHHKATVSQTVWFWHKDRWYNGMEEIQMHALHTHTHTHTQKETYTSERERNRIFNKSITSQQWRKADLLTEQVLSRHLSMGQHISMKKKKHHQPLCHMKHKNIFEMDHKCFRWLKPDVKTWIPKENNNTLDYIKIKNFHSLLNTIRK